MSYTLDLYFEPAVRRRRLLQYFTARRHFTVAEDHVLYKNPHTEVRFVISLRPGRNLLLQRTIVSAEFEINYCRPSYFGIEAEIELLVHSWRHFGRGSMMHRCAAWKKDLIPARALPSGWNFGNLFGARVAVSKDNPNLGITSMPAEKLRAAWAWNHRRAEEAKRLDHRRFVPTLTFFTVEGRPSSVVVWALGMPIRCQRSTTSWSADWFPTRSASAWHPGRKSWRSRSAPASTRLTGSPRYGVFPDAAADRGMGRLHTPRLISPHS